ncbi:MAG TPA: Ig-like domain-containing protein [Anaerolineaceae bacterium]|nr:Ig-like domain-containing protein [Anaerolineaceae bacterium]
MTSLNFRSWMRRTAVRWVAGGILLIAIMAFILLAVLNSAAGVRVVETFPQNGGEIGARGRVGITFNQLMQVDSLASLFEIQPRIPGKIEWKGNTLWFIPSKALEPGLTYIVEVRPGGVAKTGRKLTTAIRFSVRVRPAEALYLSIQDRKTDLWRQSLTGALVQLTHTGGTVYDFAPSPDGERIAYSAANDQGGFDLWLIQRDGSQNHRLAACAADRCIQPAWNPNGERIIYSRQQSKQGEAAGGPQGGLYELVVASGKSTFLFPGTSPSFSPDGQWLTSGEPSLGVISLYNQQTGERVQIQGSLSQVPTWYPDSSKMLYSILSTADGAPQENVYEIDFGEKKVSRLWKEDANLVEYSLPAVSPDGQLLVTSLHLLSGGQTKQLWLFDQNGKKLKAITQDELFNNSAFSWDPWGKSILFQQIHFGSSDAQPQVMIWDLQSGQTRTLAQGGVLPAWLP